VSKGVYRCSYTCPAEPASLSISVLCDSQPVGGSSYEVAVAAMSECQMTVVGADLVKAVAGFPATFTVISNNEPGKLGRPIYVCCYGF